MTAVTPGRLLRELLEGRPFIAADCYSALTARIVQEVGFPAAYMGGYGTSLMHFALPDYGVLTSTEMIAIAGRVAEAIDIPLIVDADEAGESVASVHRAIRRYERQGIAGVHIEDEFDPKHSVWDAPLLPIPDLRARVEAAVDARCSDDFVIIVRSNEFQVDDGGGTGSLEEMIRRAIAAAEAGADAFIPTFANEQQLAEIAAEVDLPLGGYQVPIAGLQFTLSAGWGVQVAAQEHRRVATHVFEHGTVPDDWRGYVDQGRLTDQARYNEVIRRWAEATDRPTRRLPH